MHGIRLLFKLKSGAAQTRYLLVMFAWPNPGKTQHCPEGRNGCFVWKNLYTEILKCLCKVMRGLQTPEVPTHNSEVRVQSRQTKTIVYFTRRHQYLLMSQTQTELNKAGGTWCFLSSHHLGMMRFYYLNSENCFPFGFLSSQIILLIQKNLEWIHYGLFFRASMLWFR